MMLLPRHYLANFSRRSLTREWEPPLHWKIIRKLAWDTLKDIARKVLPNLLKNNAQSKKLLVRKKKVVDNKYNVVLLTDDQESGDYFHTRERYRRKTTRIGEDYPVIKRKTLEELQEQAESVITSEIKTCFLPNA